MFLTRIAVLLTSSLRRLSILLIRLLIHCISLMDRSENKIVQIIKLVNCTAKIEFKIADEVQMFKRRFWTVFLPTSMTEKERRFKEINRSAFMWTSRFEAFCDSLSVSLSLGGGGNPILGFLFVFRKSFVNIKWPIVRYLDSIKVSIHLEYKHRTFSLMTRFVEN